MRLSSVAATFTFMSRKNALNLTLAPASRHTRANMNSVGEARFRNLPLREHVALWRPNGSRGALQPEHGLIDGEGKLELFQKQHPEQMRSDDVLQGCGRVSQGGACVVA